MNTIQVNSTPKGVAEGPSTETLSTAASSPLMIPALVLIRQILWFLLVLFVVHNILRGLRVGPILGFFGATGPEAIGYWSALDTLVTLLLNLLF